MDASAVAALLREIMPSLSPDRFELVQLGADLFLSRSHIGHPTLVVTYALGMNLPRGLETRGLRLHFHPSFAVHLGETSWAVPCGLLECVDPHHEWAFAVLVAGIVARQGADPTWLSRPTPLVRHVSDWQALLAKERSLSAEEELGLWGEMFVLLQTPTPALAVGHWHGPEAKWFDFSAPGVDVEVKTSVLAHRHHFRLHQLAPSPSGQERLIFSLLVEEDPAGGRRVDDLVADVRALLPDPQEFDEKLLQLGWRPDLEEERRYFTLREQKVVQTRDVPSVRPDPGVTEVSFVADLSGAHTVDETVTQNALARLSWAYSELRP